MTWLSYVTILIIVETVVCYPGIFIPKSYYVIDETGHKSPLVYFRSRRSSGSSASSYSSASASSSGGGSIPGSYGHFDAGYVPNFARGGFSNFEDYDFGPANLPEGVKIFSRFGEEEGSGVHVSGSAQGPHGAFSSTSAAADDTGKVRYSVKSAKY